MIFFWIALSVIAYFGLSKISKSYFEWVYQKYHVNAITIPNQIVGLLFFSPIFIGLYDDFGLNPLVLLGIPAFILLVLCLMNAKLKNPVVIVVTSICQVFYACTFIVRLFVWLCLCIGSFVKSIFTGTGYTVTYNPIINNEFKNSKLVQSKKEFSFTPEPCSGIFDHAGIYSYEINRSRIIAERNRLENEIRDVQNRKYEAMAYGFDIAEYEMQEKALQDELDSLK